MHLLKSHMLPLIAFIAILLISATVLRLAPAGDSEPLHSASNSDRLNNPVELTDKSMRYALNNSSPFVLDFYYPGCGPCKLMNNTTMELSEELGGGRSSSAG